jgi:hypothetical protein
VARTFELADGFEDEILRSQPVRAIVEDRTQAAAERASRLAADDPSTSGQDLHSNIEADVGLDAHGWVGRVNANDWKAGWFEFGTSRQAARPFLRPALEAEVGPVEQGRGQ